MRKITTIKQIVFLLLIASLCSISTLFAQIPSNDLSAYYSINGDANDLSVNANDGTVTNAVLTADRNGNQSSSWYFDGDEDYITVPHSSTLNFTSGLTVGFWVKVENTDCQIVTKGNAVGGFCIQYLTGNTIEFKLINNIGGELSNVHNANILNSWHFIVGTYDGASFTLYLDGSPVATQSFNGDIGNISDLTFGKEIADWTGGFLQGSLDDMFLFSRALSAAEISQIYTGKLDGLWEQANNPYFVCNDVHIDAFTTHTIDPGVEVFFTNQYEMTVNGCLVAVGNEGNEILFSATDTLGISLGSDKGWNGIEFLNTNTYSINPSLLNYCTIEYISYIFVSDENRGAVYVYQSDKTEFTHCTVQNNYNLNSGGGIYFDHSEGKIEDCTIQYNQTNGFGGGLLLNNCTADVSITGNIINNNTATAEGGGIYIVQGSPVLDNLTIAGNHAQYGAGACFVSTAATLQNSLINGDNQAVKNGGGVFISQGAPLFNNVTISNNVADIDGGGIYIYKGTPTFEGTTIESNTAHNGGGLYLKNYTSSITGANIFSNNATNFGGGFYISGGTPEISYILINSNNADTQGDAIYNNNGTTEVINITCYNNGDDTNEELVYNEAGTMLIENSILWENTSNSASNVTINYSDIEGGFTGLGNIENIDCDPKFENPSINDFNLKWPLFPDTLDPYRSPCIDAGNPNYWKIVPINREPDGSRRDMGAFPYFQNPLVSIWDNDDTRYLYDFGLCDLEEAYYRWFNLKNKTSTYIECPVYFEAYYPQTFMGFTIENEGNWFDSININLTPSLDTSIKIRFYPTLAENAKRYLKAGDPAFNILPIDSLLKVKGEGKGNGAIQGLIRTPGFKGIDSVSVRIHKIGTNPSYDFIVSTSEDGLYTKNNTGTGLFEITPSLIDGEYEHLFETYPEGVPVPPAAIVNVGSTSTTAVQYFKDVTVYNVSGHVYYQGTDDCQVEGVSIFLDGDEETTTNADGYFELPEVGIGVHVITAEKNGHNITQWEGAVTNHIANIVLYDDFTNHFTCSVLGGDTDCNIVLETFNPVFITLNEQSGCGLPATVYEVNNEGLILLDLPPGNYHLEVGDFQVVNGDYIQNLLSTDINLLNGDDTLNIEYHSEPAISVEWLTPDLEYYTDGLPILYQDMTYQLKINVFEVFTDDTCYLQNDSVTIVDNVSPEGLGGIVKFDLSEPYYEFTAGDPFTNEPFQKSLTVQYSYGTTKNVVEEEIMVHILGEVPLGNAFATTSPSIPLLILRDPPGDGSYSYFNNSKELSQSFSMYSQSNSSTSDALTISLGADFETEIGFIVSTTVDVDITDDLTSTFQTGMTQNSRYENTFTFRGTTGYKTGSSDNFIGPDADVYIGAAINFIYGQTKIIFKDTVDDIIKSKYGIIMVPSGFASTYMLTESQIWDHTIPDLELIGDTVSAQSWRDIVAYKYELEANPLTQIDYCNITGGIENWKESETVKSVTRTVEFEMSINEEIALAAGLTINGIGLTGESKTTWGFTNGCSQVNSTVNTTTIGYYIFDDDPGDQVLVKIYNDPVYGTAIFKPLGGGMSCPWEGYGIPRDNGIFGGVSYSKVDLAADSVAEFLITISNNSDEPRDYVLSSLSTTHAGATVLCDGANLINGGVVYPDMVAGGNQQIYISIERSLSISPYIYDSITLLLKPYCDGNGVDSQLADSAYIHLEYIIPCTYLRIAQPENNWVVNSTNNGILPIVITDYDTTETSPSNIKLEYSIDDGNSWTVFKTFEHDSIPENTLYYNWTVPGGDGDYQIRAIAYCSNDSYHSTAISGKIDREPPQLTGVSPYDGVLSPGDEISFEFDENIDPATVNINNCKIWSFRYDGFIDASVSLSGTSASLSGNIIKFSYPSYINYSIENSQVEAQLNGIKDIAGNPVSEMVTNSFFIDMGPLKWSPTNFVHDYESINIGQELFEANLKNRNAGTVYYTVNNLPWLATSPNTGSLIGPDGNIDLSFTAETDEAGVYIDTIRAETMFWPDEMIYLQVIVGNVSPVFTIHPQSQSASIGGTVNFEALAVGPGEPEDIYYTWYKDDAVISAVPNIVINGRFLTIFNLLSENFGDYKCEAQLNSYSVFSNEAILSETTVNLLDLKVFLHGPFNGTDMNTSLNSQIPLSQPYLGTPWNYEGTESVGAMLNTDIVDWVLVELRDATDAASATGTTVIWQQACFLQNDGSIIDISGNLPSFDVSVSDNLYVVIYHRNHIGIMSASALSRTNDTWSYDFTTPANQAYGTESQKVLATGIWGLWAADGDASGTIDVDDKVNHWMIQAGFSGYWSGDYDMNTKVANPDKNDKWVPNIGKQSHIPQ